MTLTRTVPAYLPFDVEVAEVRRLSPSFLRITFADPGLSEFHAGGPLGTRDTRLKLVVPADPQHRPGAGLLDVSDPGWYRRWLALDPRVRGHLRTYTARRFLPDSSSARLEIDFVLHLDDEGRGGPATEWAAQARPGERLTVLGPNRHHPEPGGFEWHPPHPVGDDVQRVLLVGDETALPAIAGILRTLPHQYAGEAIVEVPCIEDVQPLETSSGVQVTYLPRNGMVRGAATMEALHVRRPEHQAADGLYAWVAGEASVVRGVRRALVGPHRLERELVTFMGYWRHGRAEG